MGDGGFLFTGQELATARKYGLNVIVLLFNDEEYRAIRYVQERDFAGRVIDAELCNPDFLAYARAFGCDAVRLAEPDALAQAVRGALRLERPTVIELPISVRCPAWAPASDA